MYNEKKNIESSSANFLPLIPNRDLKINNEIENTNINNNTFNFEENINNANDEDKKEINNNVNDNNPIYKELINYNNKNKTRNKLNKFNINISNVSDKNLLSNKALQNIKDILFNKKIKNKNQFHYFKKLYTFNLSNNKKYYSSINKYKSSTPMNQLLNSQKNNQNNNNINNNSNSNSDIKDIINNSNNINFNNSMTNLKFKSFNTANINKNNNTLDIDFNRSDSFNKNSSYLFKCLLNDYSKSNLYKKKSKSVYKNTIQTLSPFFKLSKNEKISAKQIYRHYLKESAIDFQKSEHKKNKKISIKFNGAYDYSHVICPGLKNIYGNDKNYMNRMNEIKKNNVIALKKDFNIKDYQNTLIKLMKKNVSEKFLTNLKNKYMVFNEKNYGMIIPKGRFINLANKLKNHLSGDSYLTLQKMDKNYKIFFGNKSNKKTKKNLSSLHF